MNNLTYTVLVLLCALGLQPAKAQDFILEKLNPTINSEQYDEIAPCISSDGLTLYFTRVGHPVFNPTLIEKGQDLSKTLAKDQFHQYLQQIYSTIAGQAVPEPSRSAFNQDIWLARSIEGTFDRVHHPGYPFNNALPNSANSFGSNAHELIVINQFVEGGGMKKGFSKIVRKENGAWTFPEALSINNYHNSGADVNMTMSQDGKVMIISMERVDAIGRSDLYISYRQGNTWTSPKNLGPGVNSLWREATPHLSEDGTTLYFSSDRGMQSAGGSDIFVQYRLDDSWERWSAPQRFRSPVNSKAHDSHPYFNAATGHLYFNSTRDGSNDIFRIQIKAPAANGYELVGRVLHQQSKESLASRISIQSNDPAIDGQVYFSEDGHFRFRIAPNIDYSIWAEKDGFIGKVEQVQLPQNTLSNQSHSLDLWLQAANESPSDLPKEENLAIQLPSSKTQPLAVKQEESLAMEPKAIHVPETIEVGAKIDLLKPIYFQRSYAIVLKKSYPALHQLSTFMAAHPKVSIRIAGHTDNQGAERALMQLSEERAAAIKDYLVRKHSIAPNRIQTVGFGGHVPITSNTTERMRERNRRVEIEIIQITSPSLGLQEGEE